MMGFGKRPGPASEAQLHHARLSFAPSLQLVTSALGLAIDHIEVHGAQGLARKDVHIAAGVVPAGTVAAMKTTVSGMQNRKPLTSADMTPGLTAHRPINAIPYVCEAPAGIRTTVDLPQIIARLG